MARRRSSTKKMPKKYSGAEILEPQESTPKTQTKMPKTGIFWASWGVFFGIFGGISGSPEFRAGGGGIFFFVFFVGIPCQCHLWPATEATDVTASFDKG